MSRPRPDPDALLAQVKHEESRSRRGRLKIFFGSSAGVGKTYAMLGAARQLRAEGRDVLVGIVETHGRRETEALTEGLEILPRREIRYRDAVLREFDIDAALARRPEVILVDELAHTNAPGSRHPKRWQDVDELLSNGIDVLTTLNVQHLESLNDVVGGITGIKVWETLPDTFFDSADEIVLVDVPADELLARLKAGKVYMPAQAEAAAKNFFRKGNLMALRELAMRRAADVIEADVQEYRADKSIDSVWKTQSRLMCAIGPRAGNEHLVRSAARLAGHLGAEWAAVYVETPKLQRLPSHARERILRVVKLAADLGARTAILTGQDVCDALVDYARAQNIGLVVVGRGDTGRWLPRRSMSDAIAASDDQLDVMEVGRGARETIPEPAPTAITDEPVPAKLRERRFRYVGAAAACVLATSAAAVLHPTFDLANIVMVFLLAVVLVGVRWGRGPAMLAAVLNVASFDFFFVPPRFTFAVTDVQYLLTFAIMLIVGMLTGQLTAGVRYQARVSSHREERARTLYEYARDLSALLTLDQVAEVAESFMARAFRARVAVLVPGEDGLLRSPRAHSWGNSADAATAQWAYDRAQSAGAGTDTLASNEYLFLPLKAPMRVRGVLAIRPERARDLMIPEQRRQYETFAVLTAIAIERVHYVEVAQDALVKIQSEQLRNSLLAALSHDLRTPLAALLGLAESLPLTKPALTPGQSEIAAAVAAQSRRLIALVNNILDMARIQSGQVRLNRQWQPIEEVVGSALRSLEAALKDHPVAIDIPHDSPLVEIDAALIERVLANLLENAAKFTPRGTRITVGARREDDKLAVSVRDEGPGIAPGREEAIFEKFTRGEKESATPGMGLGLAICRAIVEAHGGTIHARNDPAGGARFTFRLPLGTPPEVVAQ